MTETYSQIGNVQRAIRTCWGYRAFRPRDSVTSASGDDRRGEHDVRDENREIQRPHEALSRERHRSDLRVIHDVADEEHRRGGERRDHAAPMLLDPARANQDVAGEQEDAGQRVQGGVDGRQVVNGHSRFAIIAIQRTGR